MCIHGSAVCTGGRPLCTQILPGQDRPPSTILGIRKLDTGLDLPSGRRRPHPSAFLVLTQCRSVTDRRTYRRICRSIQRLQVAQLYSFAARCKNRRQPFVTLYSGLFRVFYGFLQSAYGFIR